MRNVLLVSWLLLPVGAWAYHEGPGQDRKALESMDKVLVAAHDAASAGRWKAAVQGFTKALESQPKNADALRAATVQRIQLELAKARMQDGANDEARPQLEDLVDTIAGTEDHHPQLLAEARQALARSQFYNTWLLRLEGFDRDVWEPEIEAARQNWRLLAEQAGDGPAAAQHRQDLEAAIRLERMAMEDLQGMPLPKQCKGCCSCNGKKPSKKKTQGKPKPGASSGPQFDTGGS